MADKAVKIDDLTNKIKLRKNDTFSQALAHYSMGIIYDRREDVEKAAAEYREAIKCDPAEPLFHIRLGAGMLIMGKPEDAFNEFAEAEKLSPGNLEVKFLKALAYTSLKRFDDAAKEYGGITEKDPQNFKALSSLADLYVMQGKMPEAALIYEKLLLTKEGKWPIVYFNLGIVYSKLENVDEAIDNFKKAVELEPDYIEAHLALGVLHEIKKDYESAIKNYENALKIDPLNKRVYEHIGAVYYEAGRIQDAIHNYELLITLDPKDANSYIDLAYIYIKQKDSEKGIAILTDALINDVADKEALYIALGYAFSLDKKFNEAIEQYQKLLKEKPNNAKGHFFLGAAYERNGQWAEAVKVFRRAIEIDPKNAEAYNYLGYMFAEKGENLDEAVELVKKALALDPANGAYIDSLGWAYFKKGMTDEALKELEKAASVINDDPTITDHLGDVYYKKGMTDKAVGEWKKSLSLDNTQKDVEEKLQKASQE